MEQKEHEYCIRCGRKLKTPENRVRGMGDVCFQKSQIGAVQPRLFRPDKEDMMVFAPGKFLVEGLCEDAQHPIESCKSCEYKGCAFHGKDSVDYCPLAECVFQDSKYQFNCQECLYMHGLTTE